MSPLKNVRMPLVAAAALFAGCGLLSAHPAGAMVVLHPAGAVAAQQGHLIVVSTVLMLLVIVPVIALTLLFAWRYRRSNTRATYAPDWDHSTQLELVIWAVPLLIIIALGAVTWISTHTLDPYRPLQRLDAARPVAAGTEPLSVEVVALDWKWLFIYPQLGIAVVNDLAAPVDVPITFKITAASVMNSFFIPALAGQIYAMPGMQTELHAVINRPGDYDGFSANYSGAGFSDMRFKFHGMSSGDFERWVQPDCLTPLSSAP
jgi:cytochrome o ubiquinol oxidase subunit 2